MTLSKLDQLADIEGLTVEEMLEEYALDSVHPGICINPTCDYTTFSIEPDCANGYCEECETNTVSSLGILTGII